jgi:4,5-DOPA dioxygenase extradiol
MNRLQFLKAATMLSATGAIGGLSALAQMTASLPSTPLMPVFFFGHGSPMNAIETNTFTEAWRKIGDTLPKPHAILCISAHWLTKGTHVTAMEQPKTIHDFGGFPKALFEVEYPAKGSPELATATQALYKESGISVGLDDHEWGLDHGCWSILTHLYPKADIPVIQLSIDYHQPPSYHYQLAQQLKSLRKKGILIIGSGNMVHNLGMVDWKKVNEPEYGFDWALEANTKMKKFIDSYNHEALMNYKQQGTAFQLAIPTPDHYYPMLYSLGLQEKNESITYFNDKAVMGSLTMTSFRIG